MTTGLVDVDTPALQLLLRSLYRGEIDAPLTVAGLTALGLQDQSNHLLTHLRGLDRAAVHAVLVAVLAERQARD